MSNIDDGSQPHQFFLGIVSVWLERQRRDVYQPLSWQGNVPTASPFAHFLTDVAVPL